MSTIGRLFLFLNFGLALAFLGFASASLSSSEDVRGQLATLQTEFDEYKDGKEAELGDLNTKVTQLEDSRDGLRAERDQLKVERDRLEQERNNERNRNNALSSDVAEIKSTLSNYDETNRQNAARVEQANTEARDALSARRDAEDGRETALEAQREAEERLAEANNEIASLEIERENLNKRIDELDAQIQTIVAATGVNLSEIIKMPQIDGAVLQVVDLGADGGLVAINKGSNDGVQRGFTFEIYHGNTYKGQVRVDNVQADLCTATVLRAVPGTSIGQGDRASTHI